MSRRGSGFGLVVLVVVLAVVLLLAVRAWKSAMPAAAGALETSPAAEGPPPAETASPRTVDADLREVRRQADRRAEDYRETLSASD